MVFPPRLFPLGLVGRPGVAGDRRSRRWNGILADDPAGCTETVGEVGPATHTVYAFAEGYTGGAFAEFLTLQNPMNGDETVVITMLADGFVMQEQVLVKAHSRQTLYINAIINPIVDGNPPPAGIGANDVAITAQVLGTGTRIVAERPMYFGYGSDQGGTDVIGYAE